MEVWFVIDDTSGVVRPSIHPPDCASRHPSIHPPIRLLPPRCRPALRPTDPLRASTRPPPDYTSTHTSIHPSMHPYIRYFHFHFHSTKAAVAPEWARRHCGCTHSRVGRMDGRTYLGARRLRGPCGLGGGGGRSRRPAAVRARKGKTCAMP
ncbi:hypothetical protein DFP72DRAFT_911496 [Ephemerocybe angulata]|uniref:Uncharacterized protein n=1 Tax=Ephemerocybe angulata TaxID=980116 RepID=A0A8H6HPG7_9AGAR|nr:hypothetical protein DFP72DRAFT_911496 [Tulosesus angulatus]